MAQTLGSCPCTACVLLYFRGSPSQTSLARFCERLAWNLLVILTPSKGPQRYTAIWSILSIETCAFKVRRFGAMVKKLFVRHVTISRPRKSNLWFNIDDESSSKMPRFSRLIAARGRNTVKLWACHNWASETWGNGLNFGIGLGYDWGLFRGYI